MWPQQNLNSSNAAANNQKKPQTLGMTSAISMAGPKPSDLLRTDDLKEALKPYNVFESEEELNHRMEILSKLNVLVKQWIRETSIARNMPPNVADQVGGKIYTFGSYRLGVHHKGADIDALCVVPKHISRQDYFTSFYDLLKEQHEVTELRVSKREILPKLTVVIIYLEILDSESLNLKRKIKNPIHPIAFLSWRSGKHCIYSENCMLDLHSSNNL